MKHSSATYVETDLLKADGHGERSNREGEHAISVNSSEWDKTLEKLATLFDARHSAGLGMSPLHRTQKVPQAEGRAETVSDPKYTPTTHINTGIVSPLQEDETHYFATAVIAATNDHLTLATVSWLKEQLESWLDRAEPQVPGAMSPSTFAYTLPSIPDTVDACTDDTWRTSLALNLPDARDSHTAVWTGSEMIIWGGGVGDPFTPFNTGGRYNPSTDVWTATSTVHAPTPRGGHTAVWTGTEMIIWGGGWLKTGGRYNPGTDTWVATSTTNAPAGRSGHTAVWTGTQMIVWGGFSGAHGDFNTGGRYTPSTNSWTATSTTNAPAPRDFHTAVWTGSEMIVWGGEQ